jgi:hypothetical protein
MNRFLLLCPALAALTLPAWGQALARNATLTGSRGDRGKCTIEVNVDGIAEVEITGESGRLRTVAGQMANWVRFECSDPLPRDPDSFKFSGVDGRGRQILLRDPRGNRGIAVVRLEDPDGGREGYTFDIEWTGFGSGNRGGFGRLNPGRNLNSINSDRAIELCRDEARIRAERDYGYTRIFFGRVDMDRGDRVVGTFQASRGSPDEFDFACTADFNSGQVRLSELRRR